MSQSLNVLARYRVTEAPLKTERRVELVAIACVLLLLLTMALGSVGVLFAARPAAIEPAADSLRVAQLKLEQPLNAEQVAEVLARPLFWEGRRPLEAAPVVVPTYEKPKSVARLEGVELHGIFGGGESLGLIATIDGKMSRLRTGEAVKGWSLVAYENGEAVFENNGRRQTLPLALTTPSVRVDVSRDPEPQENNPPAAQSGGLTFGGGGSAPRRKQ